MSASLVGLCLLFAMSAGLVLIGLLTARACDAVVLHHRQGVERIAQAERRAHTRIEARTYTCTASGIPEWIPSGRDAA